MRERGAGTQVFDDVAEGVSVGGRIVLTGRRPWMPKFLPLCLETDRHAAEKSDQPEAVPGRRVAVDVEQIAVVIQLVRPIMWGDDPGGRDAVDETPGYGGGK